MGTQCQALSIDANTFISTALHWYWLPTSTREPAVLWHQLQGFGLLKADRQHEEKLVPNQYNFMPAVVHGHGHPPPCHSQPA